MHGIHQFPGRVIVTLALTSGLLLGSRGKIRAEELPPGSTATGTQARREVGDFSLLDQNGRFHELHRQTDKRAVVIMVAGNGCPVVRQNASKFKALQRKFSSVRFWMINASAQDDVASIAAEAKEFYTGVPVLKDETQMVTRSLGAKRTAEVFAISTKDWSVFYHGALDDQMVQGAVKVESSEQYLADALDGFLHAKEIKNPNTAAAGCLLHYESALEVADKDLSYSKHIAPILQQKCVSCHSPGNIGPFALSSYSKVRGFSDQIREEILTKRMPPWSADPHYGVFHGDRSLSAAEAQTLVRWIDLGAPRGEGEDPLALASQAPSPADEWVLGRPDYIVTPSERMAIPATGVVDYITNIVECPIPSDAWLKGAVIRPDNKKVLHHVIVYLEYPESSAGKQRWEDKWLVGWAPGAQQSFYPENTGKFLPKGCKLRFQLHYTPYGKETTDLTELGLYLHQRRPATQLRMAGVANGEFTIRPNEPDSRTLAILDFPKDTLIYELSPHMHKRGSWFRYEALYPDGKYEVLLSVPRYNFNWQHTYRLATPKTIPAGTRILCTGGFDNSKLNPDNPDPQKTVRWGDQSFDEMFIGFMTISDPPSGPGASQQQARAQ